MTPSLSVQEKVPAMAAALSPEEDAWFQSAGEDYLTDPLLTLASLAAVWSETFPARPLQREHLAKLFAARGVKRSKEQVTTSRLALSKEGMKKRDARKVEAFFALIEDSPYGTVEGIAEAHRRGEVTPASLRKLYGISPYMLIPRLRRLGCEITSAGAYTYKDAWRRLQALGFAAPRLASLCRGRTRGELYALLGEGCTGVPLSLRQLDRLLLELGVEKTPSDRALSRGRKSRGEKAVNLQRLAENGWTPEALAEAYDEDLSLTVATLGNLVNAGGPHEVSPRAIQRHLDEHSTSTTRSREENAFVARLRELTSAPLQRNCRSLIPPKEVDVYLPSLGLAIEFNGDYWHSDAFIEKNHGISAEAYHEEKRLSAAQGVTLVFVWEIFWRRHRVELEEALTVLLQAPTEPPAAILLQKSLPGGGSI